MTRANKKFSKVIENKINIQKSIVFPVNICLMDKRIEPLESLLDLRV